MMTKRRTMTIAGVSIAAVITGGALTAGALPAVAEQLTATSSDTPTSTPSAAPDADRGPHEANGIAEEELTGDVAAQVEAAVLAAYPEATIERLETDAEGAAYEAHIEQADGTRATVKLDDTFTVTGLETGGPGGGRSGGPGGGVGEEELTGDTATQVEAAVLAEYPDATIKRLETDSEGTYEAHIEQADGTRATVTLDDTFTVTGLETDGPGDGPRGDKSSEDTTSTDDSTTTTS